MSKDNFQRWYYENGGKEKLSRKRRERYRKDPEFRERVKRCSSNRYKKMQENRTHKPYENATVIQGSDGRKYFSIGHLAKHVPRQLSTVRSYIKSGVIPECNRYDPRGWRLYSFHEIQLIKKALESFDKGEFGSLQEMGRFLSERWDNAGKE